MALEDAVWEAVRPPFRPRFVRDPNAAGLGAWLKSGKGAPPNFSGAAARAALRRLVRRSPEVMVKVTGRKKGSDHVLAHLTYISRNTKTILEGRDGEILDDKSALEERAGEWADPLFWHERGEVAAVAMIFSMPEGTAPEAVLGAVRDLAWVEVGQTHDYVMALHTDTPRPHVHLTVQAVGSDRARFDPGREDLHRLRQRFAQALRSRGIDANATPRRTRAVGRAGAGIELTKMRAKVREGVRTSPTRADLQGARHAVQVVDGKAVQPAFVAKMAQRHNLVRDALRDAVGYLRSGGGEDKALAREVMDYLDQRTEVKTVPVVMVEHYAVVDAKTRNQAEEKRSRPSERPTPRR